MVRATPNSISNFVSTSVCSALLHTPAYTYTHTHTPALQSATIIHSRAQPLQGAFYANLFLHYRPIMPLLAPASSAASSASSQGQGQGQGQAAVASP